MFATQTHPRTHAHAHTQKNDTSAIGRPIGQPLRKTETILLTVTNFALAEVFAEMEDMPRSEYALIDKIAFKLWDMSDCAYALKWFSRRFPGILSFTVSGCLAI